MTSRSRPSYACPVRVLSALAAIGILTFAGCGSDGASGSAGPTDGASSSPSASPSDPVEGDPEPVLDEAVEATLDLDEIWFQAETTVTGYPIIRTEGAAGTGAWSATTTFRQPGESDSVMRARSADGSVWMQMEDWPESQARCWLAMSSTEVPLGVSALTADEPAYVSVLGALTATGYHGDPSSIDAAIDLNAAMWLLPGKLASQIAFDAASIDGVVVPTFVTVKGGRIYDLRLQGKEVRKALDGASAALPDEVSQVLDAMFVGVTYSLPASDVDLGAPDPSLVVTAEGPDCSG